MLTIKNVLIGIGFTFLLFLGIPIKINNESLEENEFSNFLRKYNKKYENESMYQYRFQAFKGSLATIKKWNMLRNSSTSSANYGITPYSDMYPSEFIDNYLQEDYSKRMFLRKTSKKPSNHFIKRDASSLPRQIDWRKFGYVSEVNNQKSCGACWAFSTVETIETMNAIKTGNITKLSTQQIIDCAENNNEGCDGGDMCTLLEWLADKKVVIEIEAKYPLHLRNEICKMDFNKTDGVQIEDYECYELVNNENTILSLLTQGPVAVAINALSWQNYLGGIIQYHCDGHPLLLNHAVQIVGYNLEAKIPYYIVRNSWGEQFGDNGYLYIQIGKNLCGIAHEVTAVNIL